MAKTLSEVYLLGHNSHFSDVQEPAWRHWQDFPGLLGAKFVYTRRRAISGRQEVAVSQLLYSKCSTK